MKSRWSCLGLLCGLVWAVSVGAQDSLIPGGADDLGLEHIAPDTIIFEHDGNLSNWEPYTSVLGDDTFLIESNTLALTADGEIDPFEQNQRYGVAIQPTDGREGVVGECFFADDGTPYVEKINSYRQDGNPGRVAGDKRPGAVNFITGGEANPNEFEAFQSDNRWELGMVRMGRFATVQTFSLNPQTLEQTPKSLAIDAINGRLEQGDPATDQIGRFGGDLAGLSNGNFLVVVDDRSGLHMAGTATSAVILAPDGSVVRDTWVIEAGDIWSNVTAYRGGFCVRKGGVLKFFDNEGEPTGQVDQNTHGLEVVDGTGNPVDFDRGRGDGTRIASHINSPYVFLSGAIRHSVGGVEVQDVFVAAYDSRDASFVAVVNVNELTEESGGTDDVNFRADTDRVGVASDALNRVVVGWEILLPDTFLARQTVIRVLDLDEDAGSFTYLTPTFFPFQNFLNEDLNIPPVRTSRPHVSMTTRAICVAAKGEINGANNPEDGADTPELNFYTVISHPDPQDDPTPPVVPSLTGVPGGAEALGLERITPDRIIFEHAGNQSNWEPYASVLGNSAFLIESNTHALTADGEIDPFEQNQRYGLAIQPIDEREGVVGDCFYADDGTPYFEKINSYRQNGNPGRVAGDTRPGAVNFITGGEASPNEFEAFQSDDRWELGLVRMGRFATVQTFSFDLETLEQTPNSLAIDAINGRLEEGDPMVDEIGRFGGDLAGLSNGNFLVVVDDRSNQHLPERATSAVILAPDGSVVRETWVIAAGDIWSNVTAYEDGFCVRKNGVMKFFDNEGEPTGEIDQNAHELELVNVDGIPADFDRGRGDGTRIASHINSPYVFLAGAITHHVDGADVEDIYVAVYDSRDASFVTAVNVNELTDDSGGTDEVDFRAGTSFDRTGVAVDALNRAVVAWEMVLPDTLLSVQTVARVLSFDEGTGSLGYLTPTFFPFVNFQNEDLNVTPIQTWRPAVSMTTRAICVAAKGQINSENLPEDGADTPELNFYTVFSHPVPLDDPTPPVEVEPPSGALLRPGDVNYDGSVNISDPVSGLNFLFAGQTLTECYVTGEAGNISLTGAGLAVLDWNGDGAHNISDPVGSLNFQFGGGTAHALGQDCVTIEGECADNCAQ